MTMVTRPPARASQLWAVSHMTPFAASLLTELPSAAAGPDSTGESTPGLSRLQLESPSTSSDSDSCRITPPQESSPSKVAIHRVAQCNPAGREADSVRILLMLYG